MTRQFVFFQQISKLNRSHYSIKIQGFLPKNLTLSHIQQICIRRFLKISRQRYGTEYINKKKLMNKVKNIVAKGENVHLSFGQIILRKSSATEASESVYTWERDLLKKIMSYRPNSVKTNRPACRLLFS